MLTINIPAYRSDDWLWTNIPFTIGIIFTVFSCVYMILNNIHFAWLQLLGALMTQLYLLPFFFRVFFAVATGEKAVLISFGTLLIIEVLLSVVSLKSFKIIEERQKESSNLP